ncbi:MAG TPA: YCF48-related protein [Candidatus Kapabacteria bacterium]|nr:YCF48-related protein [Candidatus Kapabacteria bacterium]
MKSLNYILIFIFILLLNEQAYSAWRKVNNISPALYANRTYLDITFLKSNPDFGWACGFEGTIIRTTDRGKTWRGVELRPGENIQLESINFINEKVGFVSGPNLSNTMVSNSYIYKTTDGGITWTNITPDTQNSFWGNYFVDADNGVLMGGLCGFQIFYRTSDGGKTWSISTANVSDSKLSDAFISSANGKGYAMGSGTFWETTDGGSNWVFKSETGTRDWHEDIAIVNNMILAPISPECDGQTITDKGGIAISKDLGNTWSRFNTGAAMFGTFLLDEKTGWATGFNRSIYYTNDGGTTWNLSNCGIPNGVDLDDVYFLNDTTGWAVGEGMYEFFVPKYPSPTINSDKIFICKGDSASLSIGGKFDRILWNTGETTPNIIVKEPGIYQANVYLDSLCYVAQTDAIEIKYFPKQEIFITFKGKLPLCEGDTITIIAGNTHKAYKWDDGTDGNTLRVFKSGVYTINVIDTNGCADSREVNIIVNKQPKPKIFNTYLDTFCINSGTTPVLFADSDYKTYEWIDKNTGKVVATEKLFSPSESGEYYLRVKDTSGCSGVSNIKSIFIKNATNALSFKLNRDSLHYFDSTNYKYQRCLPITLINHSAKDYILDDIYMLKNLSFSVPLSQFPLTIPAKDSINLNVCFSPLELGELRDTIKIGDICGTHLLPLLSYGVLNQSDANSKCEVPLLFNPKGISQSYSAIFYQPIPNPASDYVQISYEINKPQGQSTDFTTLLTNLMGKKFSNYEIISKSTISNNDIEVETGVIKFNTIDLANGYYVFLCKIQNQTISFPVIIEK